MRAALQRRDSGRELLTELLIAEHVGVVVAAPPVLGIDDEALGGA